MNCIVRLDPTVSKFPEISVRPGIPLADDQWTQGEEVRKKYMTTGLPALKS